VSSTTFASFFGWAGLISGLIPTYKQLQRALKVSTHGISIDTWTYICWTNLFWLAYGIAQHGIEIWMSAAVTLPLQIGIVLQLEVRKNLKKILSTGLLLMLTCCVPTLLWGWKIGILVVGFMSVLNRAPQIIKCIREKDVKGVSVSAWLWSSFCNVMWLVYYLLHDNFSAATVNIPFILTSWLIAYFAFLRQYQSSKNLPVAI